VEILRLLEDSSVVQSYEVLDFKTFSDGWYYRVEVEFGDDKRQLLACEALRQQPTNGDAMDDELQRITFDKEVLGGKPVIRGLRISVEMILELLAKGARREEVLEDYPELEPEDVDAALLYAHHLVAGEEVVDRIPA